MLTNTRSVPGTAMAFLSWDGRQCQEPDPALQKDIRVELDVVKHGSASADLSNGARRLGSGLISPLLNGGTIK